MSTVQIKKSLIVIVSAILSFLFALLVGAIIIWATGSDPMHTYSVLLRGAVGNRYALGESLIKAGVLLLTGLSFTFANKCGLINIGAEGQLYMGAAASTVIGVYAGHLPGFILLPAALLGGFAAGSLWGGVVGALKARFNCNEIIVTIMLNYIAMQFVSFLATGPIRDVNQTFPFSYTVAAAARLPRFLDGTRLHIGIFIALACLLFYWFFYKFTERGYRLQVIGKNRFAAEYAGINVRKNMFYILLLSGGFAGLGGALEILGIQFRIFENFSVGYGFDGIAAALLAGGNPLGMVFTSFLFGALKSGANAVQMFTTVPSDLVTIVQAVVIITVLMKVFSQMPSLLSRRKKAGGAPEETLTE